MSVTTKRSVTDIIENHFPLDLQTALAIYQLQADAQNLVDEFRNDNLPGRPTDYALLEATGIDQEFYGLAMRLAAYEVRL